MDIKAWVKAARKHAKLTQEGLGTKLGRTKANVSAWELGSHEPSYSQLVRISEITSYPLLANDAAGAAINILPMDRFIRLPADKQETVRKLALSALEAMEAQLSGSPAPRRALTATERGADKSPGTTLSTGQQATPPKIRGDTPQGFGGCRVRAG